jgi:hypothetical protein
MNIIPIGTKVWIGDPEELTDTTYDSDTAHGRVEAVFIYRKFIQYVVSRWVDGVKLVETVEHDEMRVDEYADYYKPVFITAEENV